MLLLKCEPENIEDRFAVAVIKSETVIGHVPKCQFLKRDFNKGVVSITRKRINRGGGFGLKVPCIFRLYDPEAYLRCLKELEGLLTT